MNYVFNLYLYSYTYWPLLDVHRKHGPGSLCECDEYYRRKGKKVVIKRLSSKLCTFLMVLVIIFQKLYEHRHIYFQFVFGGRGWKKLIRVPFHSPPTSIQHYNNCPIQIFIYGQQGCNIYAIILFNIYFFIYIVLTKYQRIHSYLQRLHKIC